MTIIMPIFAHERVYASIHPEKYIEIYSLE